MGNSDYLFKMPSFRDGAARVIDLFASFDKYNISETGEEADARAFYHDMAALSEDVSTFVPQFKEKVRQHGKK